MSYEAMIESLVDAAFSVLAHDIGPHSLGGAKDAYTNQAEALREKFKRIVKRKAKSQVRG